MSRSLTNLPPAIQGGGISIRLLNSNDAEALYRITNDPAIATIISFLTYPVAGDFAENWIAKNDGNQERIYGIFPSTDDLAGQIGVHLTPEDEIEVGYWMGSAFTGRGFTSRALSLVLKAIKASYPSARIFAECLPDNLPSLRVLEKNGFVRTSAPGKRENRIRLNYGK